ncbi:hypothetical protein G9A89_017254 [Geosiphon pyriformis]|nr:hypothetical protein G9A89_017254 [Geosiphon pyriformis]
MGKESRVDDMSPNIPYNTNNLFRATAIIITESHTNIGGHNDLEYDKSKPFLLDYETIVGSSIAVIKKSTKDFGADPVSKDQVVLFNKVVGSSWGSEARDITESNSVNMEEEFLIEEISVDYEEKDFLEGKDINQILKGPKIVTKQALGKSLGKINFLSSNDDDDILLNSPVVLPSPLKNLVNVSEKLVVVRKLFSNINGFGGAFTLSKFAGIIRASFTSELSLAQALKKAEDVKILVNTNLKKSSEQSDQAVVTLTTFKKRDQKPPVTTSAEAVHTALSEFGIIKSIKMQLVGLWQKAVVEFKQSAHADLVTAKWSILIEKDTIHVARADLDKEIWDKRDIHRVLLYTLPMKTNAYDIWDFVRSVGGKTYIIDRHLITYVHIRCAVVYFNSAESLDAVMETTPVLRDTDLH